MTRRVWVVERRRPGGEWEPVDASETRSVIIASCSYQRSKWPDREWRVVAYVPAATKDESGCDECGAADHLGACSKAWR